MLKVYRAEEKARKMVTDLMAFEKEYPDGDDDWIYEVKPCGNGLAVIQVYDEEYEFVGYL